MSGAIEFTIALPGLDSLTVGLSRLRTDIADWRPFWDERFAPFFYRTIRDNFVSEGGLTGSRWTPLSPAYAKWKQANFPGKGILERRGALRSSVSSKDAPGAIYRSTTDSVEIGTSVPYGRYHQYGAPPRNPGSRAASKLGVATARPGLPQRPFLRVDQPFMRVMGMELQKYVQDVFVKQRDAFQAAAAFGAPASAAAGRGLL